MNKIKISKYYESGRDNRAKILHGDRLVGYVTKLNGGDLRITDMSNYIQGRLITKRKRLQPIENKEDTENKYTAENKKLEYLEAWGGNVEAHNTFTGRANFYVRRMVDNWGDMGEKYCKEDDSGKKVEYKTYYEILNRKQEKINEIEYESSEKGLTALLKYCKESKLICI